MSHKEDALREIVALAKNNDITLTDITRALTDVNTQAAKTSGGILSRLLGYVGGILVFAGIGIFISMQWAEMNSAARVIATLGTGFITFIMALASLSDKRYVRAATPLFLMSALLQPAGIMVMMDEYATGGNPKHGILFMALVMLIQQGTVFYAKQRTVLAFSAIIFGCIFFATLFDLMEIEDNLIALVLGASLLCIAHSLSSSRHAAIAAFWYLIGGVVLFGAAFDIVRGTAFEVLYSGLAAFGVYISTVVRSRTLLFVSTGAMLCYIGYFTAEHFADTVGWPISLIIIGLAFIGLDAAAVRLNNKYIQKKG